MLNYPIPIGKQALQDLQSWLAAQTYSNILVLCDENTFRHCYPKIKSFLPKHLFHIIPAGEQFKHLQTCQQVWETLTQNDFDRKSLMINLGGGVVGDLGGFVAGTYKRGIDFVQVPTTLLSQVDASVGGKLGVDFKGFKNHIGLFLEPQGVYIWPEFLKTLPVEELRSGFAEVIKHHLIADSNGWERLQAVSRLQDLDLEAIIQHSVQIKASIVAEDFREAGARKSLNFGHTIGHALETYRLESPQPLRHGEAIAIGMIAEAAISESLGLISIQSLEAIKSFFLRFFPKTSINEEEVSHVLSLMKQDKKNKGNKVLCTLIEGPGKFFIDYPLSEEETRMGIDFYLS